MEYSASPELKLNIEFFKKPGPNNQYSFKAKMYDVPFDGDFDVDYLNATLARGIQKALGDKISCKGHQIVWTHTTDVVINKCMVFFGGSFIAE